MTIGELGSIGEFVAAVATVVTLAYLAIQIRQNKASVNSSNVQQAVHSFNPLNMTVGSDPVLARIIAGGTSDFEALNQEERIQYGYLLRAFVNCYWNIFQQYKLGALSEHQWLPYAHEIAFLLSEPGPTAFLETNHMYDEMFELVGSMKLDTDRLNVLLRAPD